MTYVLFKWERKDMDGVSVRFEMKKILLIHILVQIYKQYMTYHTPVAVAESPKPHLGKM